MESLDESRIVNGVIIKKLIEGWLPNHRSGILVREWWHPSLDLIEPMAERDFLTLKAVEQELDKYIIQQLKEADAEEAQRQQRIKNEEAKSRG